MEKKVILINRETNIYYCLTKNEDEKYKKDFIKNNDLVIKVIRMKDENNLLTETEIRENVLFRDLKGERIKLI